MNKFILILYSVLISLFIAPTVLAHGTAQSFPKDVDKYTIEFEYDASGVFDDTTMAFVFRLLDQKSKEPVKFDSVLARFEDSKDKSAVIVSRLYPDELLDGIARISALLNRGDYKVYLIFYKEGNKIVETNYDLNVQKGTTRKDFPLVPVVAGVLGSALGFVFGKMKKSSNER